MANQTLKNKKIIISAGASGIGLATVKVCLDRGATVFVSDINEKYINKLKKNSFIKHKNKNLKFKSIVVEHGKVNSNCFIIDKKLAYITDVSNIYKKDYTYFKNLKYLIVDCLWYNFHPSHFNLEKSLYFIKKFKPNKAILSNLSPVLDYNQLKKVIPKNVIPAHDGLTIEL